MATNFLREPILSHGQKVCRLYKQACRNIEGYFADTPNGLLDARFMMMKMRGQLEENRNVEPKVAKEMLVDFEKQLKQIENNFPYKFANSPGGTNFGRSMPDPDWVLDTWHPLEKAQFPNYFALRDIRKREFLERNERIIQEMDLASKKQ